MYRERRCMGDERKVTPGSLSLKNWNNRVFFNWDKRAMGGAGLWKRSKKEFTSLWPTRLEPRFPSRASLGHIIWTWPPHYCLSWTLLKEHCRKTLGGNLCILSNLELVAELPWTLFIIYKLKTISVTDTLEGNLAVSYKISILLPYDPIIMLLGFNPKELKTSIHTKTAHRCL